MTSHFMLTLYAGEAYFAETQCLAVTLEREVYTPYAKLTAFFLSEGADYGRVTSVALHHRGGPVFLGLMDSIRQYRKDGKVFVKVQSRSFTSVLAQNEIVPGLHADMTMQKLMTGFYTFPNVYYEDYAGSGYIYVDDGASMWDSIVNFGYKLTGRYPFIHSNTVRLTPQANPKEIILDKRQVLETGIVQDHTKLISMYHMADLEGNYDAYQLGNAVAEEAEIVRHRQIALDQEYLYDPQQALQFRSLVSQRAMRAKYVVYNDFHREELCDRVTFGDFLQNASICRVQMTYAGSGVRTKLWAYDDGFYHIEEGK